MPSAAAKAPQSIRTALLVILLLTTLFRLGLAALLPPIVDEAYVIGVARQLSLSYFDHPPLHFWLIRLTMALTGSEDILILRLPFVALGTLTGFLAYRVGAALFSAKAGLWAAALFAIAPVFGVAHGTFVLPDGPLLAAGLGLALLLTHPNLDRAPLGHWLMVGFVAGLGVLAKYHGVLFILGALVFLISRREDRRALAAPGPWVAALTAALLTLPILVWNATHDWAGFGFQLGRNQGGTLRLLGPVESLLQQAGYLLPWVMIPAGLAVIAALRSGPGNRGRWLLALLAVPPILIFTLATFAKAGLPHWPMPGWVFALPLLGERLAAAGPRLGLWARRIGIGTAVLLAPLVLVFALQARTGWLDPVLGPETATREIASWQSLAETLRSDGAVAEPRTFVAAFDWIRAGELNYVLGGHVPVLCLCDQPHHFRWLNPPGDFAGWRGVLVDKPGNLAKRGVAGSFDTLTTPSAIAVTRNGRDIISLEMAIGAGFRP
jgi:4-amino-4-deoxy-L-arabinose transferase-like glycosyltransferase